jgi:hypothetical protein
MGIKRDAETNEEEITEALRREDPSEKIILNLRTVNHRIARVAKSKGSKRKKLNGLKGRLKSGSKEHMNDAIQKKALNKEF